HLIDEAVNMLEERKNNLGFLHFNQVYPLHQSVTNYLQRAKKTIIIENNPTSQLGHLITRETELKIDESILKYNGYPFSVEEIRGRLKQII
ncbi:MAG: 2-oxoacid:acceptor oxidoreductase subunit alpha, partial [Candidatus Thorarchaeota archaeon]